ncbi:hypothetical protein MHYP_G00068130 [Metynnis hypsauchen]
MDACARIKGVPLKNRATIRKETVRENSALSLRSLLKNRKELSNVMPDLHTRESQYLPEIHFVCLPSHAEGEDFTLQALTSLSAELMELLRSLHVHTLKDEEVLFLKDPKRPFERKDGVSQAGLSRAMCILRQGGSPQISTILGLLTRYTAGIRYALELQSLQRGVSEACQAEDDDTNQSVSSIEEDFVTAFEHLEEEETAFYNKRNQRDVASQTLPPHFKDLSGSRIIISSISKKSVNKEKSAAAVSGTKQKAPPSWSGGTEGPWSLSMPSSPPKACITSTSLTESDESDCSSPSPIIFLDEIGYQKSLKAKLDIPKIPVLKEGVEDSDSEVSEFFDSFDQFDDLDQHFESCVQMPKEQALFSQKKKQSDSSVSKYASKGGSTTVMNPHKFDHRTLPANVKKPTPLKPGSPYNIQSDAPDSPRPTRTSCEESGGLFSPVRSSAFSPLGEGGALECFWKVDGDGSELRKPQDLCSLYKTYSDFANNLSKEILGTVCGYSSPIDININKNLSCVCHKEFKNTNGHLMKLSDIQETVTIAKTQSQSLKDGIQKFATDLVEMSIGSALRDLQKGVSSCTTTLCHLAARLTSSVFQMAFQEIGMRHAYVLKERAINGLASFLVGEAVSGALKEFLFVKKQIFNNTVTRFASDLAEELIFESIMEVCQFSHPSTPLSPRDWSFDQEEEVVCSYASDLSESVLQEAFIELSQADVTFTTQAAISVSLDNICYVSAEDTSQTMKICNARSSYQEPRSHAQGETQEEDGCTVKKALYCVSGMASCVPVPAAGKAISFLHNPEETCHYKSSISHTCQTSPKRSICSQGRAVTSTSDTATPSESVPSISKIHNACGHFGNTGTTSGKSATGKSFHNFSGAMVDTIVGEAFDIMTTRKMKKKVEDCADFLSKTIGCRMTTTGIGVPTKSQDVACQSSAPYDLGFSQNIVSFVPKGGVADSSSFCSPQPHLSFGSKNTDKAGCESVSRCIRPASKSTPEVHSAMIKDTLEVPSFEVSVRGSRNVVTVEVSSSNTGAKSNGTPGTPPSTPQQPSDISSEKQIKQFSKKLKGKLAKEFSPATPPPTPHYQPTPGLKDEGSESDKAEFMLKLMRSLSEEAVNNEDEDDDQEDGLNSGDHYAELTPSVGNRTIERGALHYAERLACHIVSMATEMDTISFGDGVKKQGDDESKGGVALHSAQFSEQTLNSLWTYAGEIAGEVISDVKRMMSSSHCRHKATKQGSSKADNRLGGDQKDCRLTNMTVQWSNDFLAPVLNHQRSTSSGMSSEYPSCESVTDEYAGRDGRLKYQGLQKRMRQDCDGVAGLEIPKIHIDLDKRAVFAEEMVSAAIEKAKKELSSTSLNADSGIGHDGASFAESLTTEIMTSALSNVCQTINLSAPGRESVNVTESTVSQQLNLSVGDDSLGSWSNLSFEEDHPDESSSFHHLSDSNGNSSSWSSLGLEGEVYEEHLSFSPSDSDYTEEKETEAKNDLGGTVRVERGHAQADRALLVVSTDVWGQAPDPQLRAVLQWMAASIVELPFMQFSQQSERELQQFLAVVQRLREREWRVGELLQALLRYYEEYPTEEEPGAVDARHVNSTVLKAQSGPEAQQPSGTRPASCAPVNSCLKELLESGRDCEA